MKEKLRPYLEGNQKVIIFSNSENQVAIERCLLEIQPAFFHVQVLTIQRYVLDLLKKHHHFEIQPLSKKTSLLGVLESLKLPDLTYFKHVQITEGLINALLEAFEILSDLNGEELPNTGKWQDLKGMYQVFCDYKQEEYSFNELLQKALPYIEKDVTYVDLSFSDYSLSLDRFLKKCHVQTFEWERKEVELEFYQPQFKHQEIELAINKISQGLKEGWRYQDFVVYVPDTEWKSEFVKTCPYPCGYHQGMVNNREEAFMDAFVSYDVEKMRRYVDVEEDFFERLPEKRNALLETVVSFPLETLPDDLDFDVYRLLIKMLRSSSRLEKDVELDRIHLLTYQTPHLFKKFKHTFFLGLNEDVYPSKMSESALILNDELTPFYPEKTPLVRNQISEYGCIEAILSESRLVTVSCHFGALDGSEALPSLLYKQLKGNQKEKKATFPLPSFVDELSASFDGCPPPLENARDVYQKQGISPSELETYNACPYKHFLSYGMRIRPTRRKLETRAKFGTLMHDLLDDVAPLFRGDFYEALEMFEERYHLDAKETLDHRLEAIVFALLYRRNIVIENAEEDYLYKVFPNQFLNTLKILLMHLASGEFKMAYHEEALHYTIDGVNYLGKVDRADVYKNYLKIVDYKSSNKTLDLALALEGFNVQMVMYLEMLAQNKNMDKGALLYFNTSPRKIDATGNMHNDATSVMDFESAYQMEGWILKEDRHEVMYGIDHNFPESHIAHIKYVKSKDDYTGRLLEKHQLDHLVSHIFTYLHGLVEACFNEGNIAIQPAGSDDLSTHMKVSPCQYCDYQDVCMRDPFYHEFRAVKVMKKEELENLLEGGEE